ncbi:MAG: capsular biosynthesis protein [Muribaculaceae bacterium]|nr:capsular biosynthesis protein [Muribaculaceae bacterium]
MYKLQVWLTPHIMEDIPNTTDQLRERFKQLSDAYTGSIKLHLAAENMMDALFEERLNAGDLLPIGSAGKTLLVETSYYTPPLHLEDIFEEIKSKGFNPLLAHPERYCYIDSLKRYKRLKDMGVRFQLNILSLAGAYGPGPQKKSVDMLRLGMYDAYGSDLHRHHQFGQIQSIALSSTIHDHLRQINPTL